MKYLCFVISGICITPMLSADSMREFKYEPERICQEMSQLDLLESYVTSNSGITFAEVKLARPELISGVDGEADFDLVISSMEAPNWIWFVIAGCLVVFAISCLTISLQPYP